MFATAVINYVNTIIDTKYSNNKKTRETACKYCGAVINDFLDKFAELNPAVVEYLDSQPLVMDLPRSATIAPVVKVSFFTDIFKPVVQQLVGSVLAAHDTDGQLNLARPIVAARITRVVYNNLTAKTPASRIVITDYSKTYPVYGSAATDPSEASEWVVKCREAMAALQSYKAQIEQATMRREEALWRITNDEPTTSALRAYAAHVVELVLKDTCEWCIGQQQALAEKKKQKKTSAAAAAATPVVVVSRRQPTAPAEPPRKPSSTTLPSIRTEVLLVHEDSGMDSNFGSGDDLIVGSDLLLGGGDDIDNML